MNGDSAFGWIKAIAALAVLALLGFVAYKVLHYFKGKSPLDVAQDLKKTPVGIPSRAIDTVISTATGRDETLGGFIAELFDPTTRAANASLKTKPTGAQPFDPYAVNPRDRN